MTIANIETLTRFLTKTNTTSLTAAQLLILDNKYYEEIVGRIIAATAGARTQFGDFNYTAFPTHTISMSDGVQNYDLGDISVRPLTIMGIECTDVDGNTFPLTKTSLKEIHEKGESYAGHYENNGLPLEYEIRDNQIVLYPTPDDGTSVTLSNGLIIYYLRTADVYTSAQQSTGTKVPGFPAPWHDLMSYGPAYDYALANGLPNANHFRAEYDRRMNEMLDFITKSNQDERPRFTTKAIQYK